MSAHGGAAVACGTGSRQGWGECLGAFAERKGRTVIELWEAGGEQALHQTCLPIY